MLFFMSKLSKAKLKEKYLELMYQYFYTNYNFFLPVIRDNMNRIIKTTKIIFAIPAAAPAIPPNPRIPAINAIIIKVIVQRNIVIFF